MKKVISILLILLLLWQTIFKIGIITYWKVNQTSITNMLCENQDKPEMHCNGKCYLTKQLKQAEENNDISGFPMELLKLKYSEDFLIQNIKVYKKYTESNLKPYTSFYYTLFLSIGYLTSFFQPPEF